MGELIPIGVHKKFKGSEQDNFSRTIKVIPANLSGNGTIEEQICEYVNSLNFVKQETDADVWIQFDNYLLPIDAVVSDWSNWSSCVDGEQTRTRSIITPATNGGITPDLIETQACTIPVDAIVSDWSNWSSCVAGSQTRTRTLITPASNGGITPDLIETQACTPVYAGQTYLIAGENRKDINYLNSTGELNTDPIYSTVNVYFDGVLKSNSILDRVINPTYNEIGSSFVNYCHQGVTVTIEHILDPTNDFTVKSEIKRYNYPGGGAVISSETVTGTLGSTVTNTLTFIMPNIPVSFVATANFV
jgi:hypothetical protein